MNKQQKIQMWKAFAVAFPYLQMTENQTIEYGGVCLFKFTPNYFNNRIFYGPLNVSLGGRSPFYSVTCVRPGLHISDPDLLFDDDIGQTIYDTTDEKKERTARFWAEVDKTAVPRIAELAQTQVKACLKRGAFRHLRMLAGVQVWTRPRLRAVLIRAIPTLDEQEHNRYLKRRRALFAHSLKHRRFKITQMCENWADLKEIATLTWQMSALGRIVRGAA